MRLFLCPERLTMSTPVPSSKFATLAGSLFGFVPGTVNANSLLGSATIYPRRTSVAVSNATPVPAIVCIPVTVAALVNGSFSGVKLLGGNIPESNWKDWTWHVEFDVRTDQGITVNIDEFDFVALAGQSMDIATLVRCEASTGVAQVPVAGPPVDPEPEPDVEANFQDPYSSDGDGVDQDYIYIYPSDDIDWFLNDSPVLAGQHYVTGEVTVTAVAKSGRVLPAGRGSYPFYLSAASATRVFSVPPVWNHAAGSADIPSVEGLEYTDQYGNPLAQGTTVTDLAGLTTFYVNAIDGFINDGASYFQHDFSLTLSDAPSVTQDDAARTFTLGVADGVEYRHGQFTPIDAGTHNLSDYEPYGDYIMLRAFPLQGRVLPSGANYDEFPLYYTAV
jgi:hypothetical protein